MSTTLISFVLVGTGGAIGSMLRYGIKLLTPAFDPAQSFPWATFVANVTGSFVIGLLGGLLSADPLDRVRLLLVTGVLGGFTTFSMFSLESIQLLRAERLWTLAVYVVLTNVMCVGMAMAGFRLMKG